MIYASFNYDVDSQVTQGQAIANATDLMRKTQDISVVHVNDVKIFTSSALPYQGQVN